MLFKKLCYIFVMIQVMLCVVNGHKPKSSLVFVVDRTSSMALVIQKIIETVDNIIDAALSNESRIEEFILVAFDDPGTEIKAKTSDRDEFKAALESIKLVNGGNCPEYSMSGIEEAAKISKPNSIIYVFTDASAADYAKINIVRNLSEIKSIQINFILTGVCKRYAGKYYAVYEELAEATSGQIFHIRRDEVTKCLKYIAESVKKERRTLIRKIIKKDEHSIQFTIDSEIYDVMISVSSDSPNYRVTDVDGNVIETEEILHTKKNTVDKMNAKPGVYTITINDNVSTDSMVIVTGSSHICLQYGFSLVEPRFLNETVARPIKGTTENQYLLIKSQNSERDVQLETAELKDSDDNILQVLALSIINKQEQLYTTEAFKPPYGKFNITVNGVTSNKDTIKCTTTNENFSS